MAQETFGQIWNKVLLYAPGTPVPLVQQFVRNAYNRCLTQHYWSELLAEGEKEIATEYSTGTVDVTNGSTTVEGSGTTWTSDMATRQLIVTGFNSAEFYTIESVTDGDTLVLDRAYKGPVQASVREATAKYEIAREQYEATRREIEGKVRSAFLSAQASNARIGSTGEEVKALEKLVEAQQRSFEVGVTTVLDVVIARRRLIKSRADHSKARYDYIRDFTVLRVQSGALNRMNIEEIDSWLARSRP